MYSASSLFGAFPILSLPQDALQRLASTGAKRAALVFNRRYVTATYENWKCYTPTIAQLKGADRILAEVRRLLVVLSTYSDCQF